MPELASKLEINLKTIYVPTNYRDGDIGKEFVIELERFINQAQVTKNTCS
ncbi:hypothetical protein [Schnuerera sp.]|nr:hypothetical protein [Schnuerera sp.]HSH36254.1 hypothetical protein [Schnuerera sp.]